MATPKKDDSNKNSEKTSKTTKATKSSKAETKSETKAQTESKPAKTARTSKAQVAEAEKKLDTAMENAQKYMDSKVSPENREKAEELVSKADNVIGSVEELGATFLDDMFGGVWPNKKGSTSSFDATFAPKFSRLFIFRFLWYIVQGPVMAIWALWYGLISIFFVVGFFVTGERNKNLWSRMIRFWKHCISWKAYVIGLVDKRPPMVTPA